MPDPPHRVNDSAPAPARIALGSVSTFPPSGRTTGMWRRTLRCGGREPGASGPRWPSDQPMSSRRTPLVSFMKRATKTIDSAAKTAYAR